MAHKIITISRQFGSGGREIGMLVAERLGIKCYDKELIAMAAEHGDLEYKRLRKLDEKTDNPWYYEVIYDGNHNVSKGKTASVVLFNLESAVIKNIARTEDAVIVGRCADYILRDTDTKLLTVFIYAPFESRVLRKMDIENKGQARTEALIKKMDKQRSAYYEAHVGKLWGDAERYDLFFDSSMQTKDEITQEIISAYKKLN